MNKHTKDILIKFLIIVALGFSIYFAWGTTQVRIQHIDPYRSVYDMDYNVFRQPEPYEIKQRDNEGRRQMASNTLGLVVSLGLFFLINNLYKQTGEKGEKTKR